MKISVRSGHTVAADDFIPSINLATAPMRSLTTCGADSSNLRDDVEKTIHDHENPIEFDEVTVVQFANIITEKLSRSKQKI
jgi:hypothetical protein